MGEFRRAGDELVNSFEIGGIYFFRHYFEGEDVFNRLKRYYNNQQYRFEVPASDFDSIRSFLREHGYGLVTVDAIEEFAVVVKKYTNHPENIFKDSVIHRSVDGYNCFVMVDQLAVERAVREGAIRLTATGFGNPF